MKSTEVLAHSTDSWSPGLAAVAELDGAIRPDGQAALVVQTFFGVTSRPVPADRVDGVAKALEGVDACALYQIGYSCAPFHCPDCAASYCGEHWSWRTFEDDPYSGVEGDCPLGHFHVLAY
ncbi:hypothetical protein [Mycobacterium angelicum]|uniref:hypothetical protein n=1 Tax=Mycobacterium angelicum TaxID=470074 RepID=UPI00111C8934|nr:hypothetical protein [Mycobacterium angelicum]MCV7195204.1 hypothetical protein [Mycobacterium angelicum]